MGEKNSIKHSIEPEARGQGMVEGWARVEGWADGWLDGWAYYYLLQYMYFSCKFFTSTINEERKGSMKCFWFLIFVI